MNISGAGFSIPLATSRPNPAAESPPVNPASNPSSTRPEPDDRPEVRVRQSQAPERLETDTPEQPPRQAPDSGPPADDTPEQPPESVPLTPLEPSEPAPRLSIEITPSEDNVSTGDRSNNSATITLETPNLSISREVTRQEVADNAEDRSQQALARAALGIDQPGPVARATLRNADLDNSDIETLAVARNQQNLANTYLNIAQPDDNTNSGASSSNPAVELANEAIDARTRQTLLFSGVERLGDSGISTKA
ncbi:MAG: hypothetical protein AseanaTS_23210 [Candidatus Pelagadaptatus aseana]|uniref:hypothetical protein n=1 Tax=Candidatus Pelagadaptatus aseana TaxID=3120508 RepID=UPI0039B16BF7